VKRALVVNIARMGDLIQSASLLSGLKKHGYEVTLLFSAAFCKVAKMLPDIDRAISFPLTSIVMPLIQPNGRLADSYIALKELTDRLHSDGYDLVVNITHTHFSAALCRLIDGKRTIGMTLDKQGQKLVNGRWTNYYLNANLNRHYNRFNLVDIHYKLGCIIDGDEKNVNANVDDNANVNANDNYNGRALRLKVSAEAFQKTKYLVRNVQSKARLIGIVPGASTVEKRWPAENFAEMLKILGAQLSIYPLIFGAESESELCASVAAHIPAALNLAGKTDLALLAALIKQCDLLITNDTGPMHIAAAVGTPVLDISLGSAMAEETAPYGVGHIIVEPRLDCFPCLPKMRCGHHSCHKSVSAQFAAELAQSMLTNEFCDAIAARYAIDAKTYRTAFDVDGFLKLTSLFRDELTPRAMLNAILKEVWKDVLDGRFEAVKDISAGDIAAQIMNEYSLDNYGFVRDWMLNFRLALDELKSLAQEGQGIAGRLKMICGRNGQIAQISELGKRSADIDADIIRLAYKERDLMPLATQFTYAKDGIDGADLHSLASQTEQLYAELAWNCQVVGRLLSEVHHKLAVQLSSIDLTSRDAGPNIINPLWLSAYK